MASEVDRRELSALVADSLPDHGPDIWLGQIVIEMQLATDRAVAWAQTRAEAVVASAQVEADEIRERGHRRAQVLARIRGIARPPTPIRAKGVPRWPHTASRRSEASPASQLPLLPVPPRARRLTTEEIAPIGASIAPLARPSLLDESSEDLGPWSRSNGHAPVVAVPFRPPTIVSSVVGGSTTLPASTSSYQPGVSAAESLSLQDDLGVPDVFLEPIEPSWRPLRLDTGSLLVAVAILSIALGFMGFEHLGTAAEEHRSQHALSAQFVDAEARPPLTVTPISGRVFALISIPRIGISGQAIVEGATLSHLQEGPAHDSASQQPGRSGPIVILGHRRAFGGSFARLGDLRIGDEIQLRTTSGVYAYRVTRNPQVLSSTLVLPSDAEVRAAGGNTGHVDQVLVLATGVGSGDSPLKVVAATLDQASSISAAGVTPSAPTTTVVRSVPAQRIGVLWAIVWLCLLLGIVVTARRLRTRFLPVVVYAIAVLVALPFVYQMYGSLDRLVPGTY